MVERKKKIIEEYGQRYNVWTYKTSKNGQEDEIAYKHPAIFPIQLVKDHIVSWSNEGDVIFDPFMGSGTTAKAAIQTNRNYLGSEISEEYYNICLERVKIN
jgi:site-specific DNA-methyltransferase (adenine-specific)